MPTSRLVPFVLLVMVGCAILGERTLGAQPSDVLMSIAIYDYAGLVSNQLQRAERAVSRLYRASGVGLTWVEPNHLLAVRSEASQAAQPAVADLALIILNAKMTSALAPPKDALGCALGTQRERGRIAYVFFDRLVAIARTEEEIADLMSLVIAHEIGHLLLPFGSHADTGVMRPVWNANELRHLEVARLSFTPAQLGEIQRRLLRLLPMLAPATR
jgi:hypothetical protein